MADLMDLSIALGRFAALPAQDQALLVLALILAASLLLAASPWPRPRTAAAPGGLRRLLRRAPSERSEGRATPVGSLRRPAPHRAA